ncbi:hypothetical protein F5Y04DRAFT_284982 [Hypomontagnella monticulosa]|nr:hypothetical protein F5Y04DRAFT_284982 [Hypomontagnella monticulosa]
MANIDTLTSGVGALTIDADSPSRSQSQGLSEQSLTQENKSQVPDDLRNILVVSSVLETLLDTLPLDGGWLSTDGGIVVPSLHYRQVDILIRRLIKLDDKAATLKRKARDGVVTEMLGRGGRKETGIDDLLIRFKEQINAIADDILADPGNQDERLLLRLAEKYYRAVIDQDGALNFHLSGLPRVSRDNDGIERLWVNFWARVFGGSLGSTLFDPSMTPHFGLRGFDLDSLPPYLFRFFGSESQGKNDEEIMEPWAVASGHVNGTMDLLSMEESSASSMLCEHCKNHNRRSSDNLVSWTSSLLFAIQGAIFYQYKKRESGIKICVIDTKRFPRGQFVRDISLYDAYSEDIKAKDRWLFDNRQPGVEYDNGEYLSQGLMNHSGRSCVVPFSVLEENGLYELYPELKFENSGGKWTNRVKELRVAWSCEVTTPQQHVDGALAVAREFSRVFPTWEVATILLCLKNRKLQPATGDEGRHGVETNLPAWVAGPQEVKWYFTAMRMAEEMGLSDGIGVRSQRLNDKEILESIFELGASHP